MSPYTWRPIQVLVDGAWVPGSLIAWRRDPDAGWRALVQYTLAPGMTYLHWRPAAEVRPG